MGKTALLGKVGAEVHASLGQGFGSQASLCLAFSSYTHWLCNTGQELTLSKNCHEDKKTLE